jgi:pseudouridine kinase
MGMTSEERNVEAANGKPALVIGAAGLDMVGVVQDGAAAAGSNPSEIRVSFGGVARNVAENLARLGQSVILLTAVGNDLLGEQLLAYTASCGVDVSHCLRASGASSASYMAVYKSSGGQVIALDDMRVLAEISPEFILAQREQFAQAGLVFVDANLREDTLETIFNLARDENVLICADTASSKMAVKLLPYLDEIYMITANMVEASKINPGTPEVTGRFSALQAVRQLVNRGVEIAIIPLAHFGVCYATSETSGHVPAVRTTVVDPTGAGDALTATVLFGQLNDIPIDESVRLGVTAASLILRYSGTVYPGLTLEKLYDELVI